MRRRREEAVETGEKPYDPRLFGAALRRNRTSRDWSQRDLAKKLNISHTYVSQLENGRLVEVTLSFLRRIGAVFGMTWEQFVEEFGVNADAMAHTERRHETDLLVLTEEAADLPLRQLRALIGFARVMKEGNAIGNGDDLPPSTAEQREDPPAPQGPEEEPPVL